MTTDADRQLLLRIAREAIAAHLNGLPSPELPASGATGGRCGAFVTLHQGRELRGCIGHIESDEPLGRLVARCAIAAATEDPRFPPIAAGDLAGITIELSLLGPLERVDEVGRIEVGRHGLVVEMGWRRGLLLPQVATEWGWDRELFLAQTCHKAGLPGDAWRTGAKIWRFEAEVFAEAPASQGIG
jgi:uncharacterized protein